MKLERHTDETRDQPHICVRLKVLFCLYREMVVQCCKQIKSDMSVLNSRSGDQVLHTDSQHSSLPASTNPYFF